MRVGFIGTGTMGGPMAANILAAGNQLNVFDIDRSTTISLEEAGALVCGELADLVRESEIVMMSLPGPTEVCSVAQEVLESMSAGQILVDMSTNSPALLKDIALLAESKGVSVLDAPVSGGVYGARKGTLTLMIGGDKAKFDQLKPVWNCIGSNIFYLGGVGSGNVAKLVNNMLAFSIMMTNAEALVLGAKMGIDLNVLWNVVKVSSGGSVTWEGGGRAILKDRLSPMFTVDLACKDIGLATELAGQVGVDLSMVSRAEELLRKFQNDGFAQEDILATIKALEKSVGVNVRGVWKE